ncbi:MAG: hypothetical protein ACRDY0_10780 [Acidimicrobiales bacterium]
MTQPGYVPIAPSDRVRPSDRLPAPRPWSADRPADLVPGDTPAGPGLGATGPDLGFGLKLARRFAGRLSLSEGESAADAVAGCFACGAKRASVYHRAPVVHDMEWAYTLWGFLGDPPPDLVVARRPLFRGAAHHYREQRAVVDSVRPETFRLTPAEVAQRAASWREMILVPAES